MKTAHAAHYAAHLLSQMEPHILRLADDSHSLLCSYLFTCAPSSVCTNAAKRKSTSKQTKTEQKRMHKTQKKTLNCHHVAVYTNLILIDHRHVHVYVLGGAVVPFELVHDAL